MASFFLNCISFCLATNREVLVRYFVKELAQIEIYIVFSFELLCSPYTTNEKRLCMSPSGNQALHVFKHDLALHPSIHICIYNLLKYKNEHQNQVYFHLYSLFEKDFLLYPWVS